jgi:hypothetical protein
MLDPIHVDVKGASQGPYGNIFGIYLALRLHSCGDSPPPFCPLKKDAAAFTKMKAAALEIPV